MVAKAMKQAAEKEMKVLHNKSNDVFKLVKFMRKDGKDINGGGCMKDKDGRLVVSEKDRGKLWKDHMEKIMKWKTNGIRWQKQIWLKDQLKKSLMRR